MRVSFGAAQHIIRLQKQGDAQPANLNADQKEHLLYCWMHQLTGKPETAVWGNPGDTFLYLTGKTHTAFEKIPKPTDRLDFKQKVLAQPTLPTAEAVYTEDPAKDYWQRYQVVEIKSLENPG